MRDNDPYPIRPYRASDLAALAAIYALAIRHLGPSAYTDDQIRAWAGFARQHDAFRAWIEEAETLVAENASGRVVAFAGLVGATHVSALFVAPEHQRRGIGSTLLTRLMDRAWARRAGALSAHASEFSRPLFERHGFVVSHVEHTEVDGIAFTRYAMRSD
jgi:putative acetyltransferase